MILTLAVLIGFGSVSGAANPAASQPTGVARPVEVLCQTVAAARAGDSAGVQRRLWPEQPFDQGMFIAFGAVAVARQRFEAAVVKQFGIAPAAAAGVDPAKEFEALREATAHIDGDSAVVTLPASTAAPVRLHRLSGSWRVSPDFVVNRIENAAPHELGGRYITMAQSLDAVTDDIAAGHYPTASAAVRAADIATSRADAGTDSQ